MYTNLFTASNYHVTYHQFKKNAKNENKNNHTKSKEKEKEKEKKKKKKKKKLVAGETQTHPWV
jgi:hypothetical protein